MNPPKKKNRARASAVVRVGLVEDSPAAARLVTEMLVEAGEGQFAVKLESRKLSEAISALKSGADEIDVVLLNLSLPDSHGIDTFKYLSRSVPRLPVIVLGEADDEKLAVETVHEGAQDYLGKADLTGRVLVRAITSAIERKRAELEQAGVRDMLEARVEERTGELQETNRHLAEALEQLGEAQALMIQQERLYALERMASGIAHDFNNALSPILAHTEWLLMKPEMLRNPETLQQTLVKIHESAAHCGEVVNRLREFYRSRDEMGQLSPVSLSAIVEDAVSLTQPCWKDQALARGVNIRVDLEFDETPQVLGDAVELREMLTNLLLNAVDAISQAGVIRASVFEEDGRVCVRIGDNGAGMSEEVGARCMEPFFTTKHGLGTGLGLGVVYGIAQRHEAEINIESDLGVGTEITVRFSPFTPGPAEEKAVMPVVGLRVLVAEDEPMIREVLGVYLAEDGHRVEMAANGAEALQKLTQDRFDLLLTDHSMPEVSGERLAREARARDPKLRIMMLSGFGHLMEPPDGTPPSIDVLIPKPFTFESLRRGIAQAVATPGGRPTAYSEPESKLVSVPARMPSSLVIQAALLG